MTSEPSGATMVIPTFNEAGRLDVEAVHRFAASGPGYRICFVDDGSRDTTPQLVDDLRDRFPKHIDVLHLPSNLGKAEAVRRGMVRAFDAGAAVAGFIDADLSAPFSEVPALEADLAAHPDCWAIFGSRVKLLGRRIERSEWRHYLGRVFATVASMALALPVYDTQCGLKLFRNRPEVRAVFETPFLSRWIFDVEVLARLAQAAGPSIVTRVREVPLESWQEHGDSRVKGTDFLVAPLELLRIRRAYRRTRS